MRYCCWGWRRLLAAHDEAQRYWRGIFHFTLQATSPDEYWSAAPEQALEIREKHAPEVDAAEEVRVEVDSKVGQLAVVGNRPK